jgi:hypothetical protein
VFPNRSRAIQAAVEEKIARLERTRLARECAKLDANLEAAVADKLERLGRTRLAAECCKLDQAAEKALAEEGLSGEIGEWPEY